MSDRTPAMERQLEKILGELRRAIRRDGWRDSWYYAQLFPFAERLARAEQCIETIELDRDLHRERADRAEAECQRLGRRYASITDAARRAGVERLEEEAEGGLTDGERVDRIERAFRLAAFHSKNGCIVCTKWPHQEHCPVLQMGEKVTGWSFAPGAEFNPARSKP